MSTAAALHALEAAVQRELEDAIQFAEASPEPELEDALQDIYA
jgi:TPP-dependent pyruvate/acetoin dehydrogenase alpha subunit